MADDQSEGPSEGEQKGSGAGEGTDAASALVVAVSEELEREGIEPPKAKRAARRAGQKVTAVFEATYHSGPLPLPEILAQYEAACPGAARDIINMAVRAQTHSHEMARSALSSETNYRNIGLGAAVAVVALLTLGAVLCAYFRQPWPASLMASAAGLSILAAAFIRGRNLFGLGYSESEEGEAPRPEPEPSVDDRAEPTLPPI